jgi:hypothetical protein
MYFTKFISRFAFHKGKMDLINHIYVSLGDTYFLHVVASLWGREKMVMKMFIDFCQ